MLILSGKSNFRPETSAHDDMMKLAGIKEARRNLILFVDKTEYENERSGFPPDPLKSKIGLAFLINLSISGGMGAFTDLYKRHNTSIIRMNVYSFDVLFNNGFKDVNAASFTLRSAFGSEILNAYDGFNDQTSDLNVYNRIYSGSLGMDSARFTNSVPHLIPPEYYNAEQMYFERNDFWGLQDDSPSSFFYSGSQLIDRSTEIRLMDVGSWSSVERSLKATYDKVAEEQLAEEAVGDVFLNVAPSMISGTSFVYDTQLGQNISGGSVPFQSYRKPKSIVDTLTEINALIKMECELLEEEHGSLRVFYVPFLHGDRIRIICKDKGNEVIDRPFSIDRDFTTTTAAASLAEGHGAPTYDFD